MARQGPRLYHKRTSCNPLFTGVLHLLCAKNSHDIPFTVENLSPGFYWFEIIGIIPMPEGGVTDTEELHHFGFTQILITIGRCLFGPGLPDGLFEKMIGKVLEVLGRDLNGYADAAILDNRL